MRTFFDAQNQNNGLALLLHKKKHKAYKKGSQITSKPPRNASLRNPKSIENA